MGVMLLFSALYNILLCVMMALWSDLTIEDDVMNKNRFQIIHR